MLAISMEVTSLACSRASPRIQKWVDRTSACLSCAWRAGLLLQFVIFAVTLGIVLSAAFLPTTLCLLLGGSLTHVLFTKFVGIFKQGSEGLSWVAEVSGDDIGWNDIR